MDKKGIKDDSEVDLTLDAESDTDQENEVLSFLYHFINSKAYSFKMMEKYDLLLSKHKVLEKYFLITSGASNRKEQTNSELNDKIFLLNSSNLSLRSKIAKLEEEIISRTSESVSEKKHKNSLKTS